MHPRGTGAAPPGCWQGPPPVVWLAPLPYSFLAPKQLGSPLHTTCPLSHPPRCFWGRNHRKDEAGAGSTSPVMSGVSHQRALIRKGQRRRPLHVAQGKGDSR